MKNHYRLKSTILDFKLETAPVIKWVTTNGNRALPDLTELLYQNYFPN